MTSSSPRRRCLSPSLPLVCRRRRYRLSLRCSLRRCSLQTGCLRRSADAATAAARPAISTDAAIAAPWLRGLSMSSPATCHRQIPAVTAEALTLSLSSPHPVAVVTTALTAAVIVTSPSPRCHRQLCHRCSCGLCSCPVSCSKKGLSKYAACVVGVLHPVYDVGCQEIICTDDGAMAAYNCVSRPLALDEGKT